MRFEECLIYRTLETCILSRSISHRRNKRKSSFLCAIFFCVKRKLRLLPSTAGNKRWYIFITHKATNETFSWWPYWCLLQTENVCIREKLNFQRQKLFAFRTPLWRYVSEDTLLVSQLWIAGSKKFFKLEYWAFSVSQFVTGIKIKIKQENIYVAPKSRKFILNLKTDISNVLNDENTLRNKKCVDASFYWHPQGTACRRQVITNVWRTIQPYAEKQ